MYSKNILFVFIILFNAMPYSAYAEEKTLTLEQAYSLAIENNPDLSIYKTDVKINESKTIQSGLPQNPELSAELENIGGATEVTGGYQLTSSVKQTFEWNEKRDSRVKLSLIAKDITNLKYQIKKSDLKIDISKAFIDVLNNQELLKLTEQIFDINQKICNITSQKVDAGKISPIEKNRAKINLSTLKIEVDKAKEILKNSNIKLAYILGISTHTFNKLQGNFYLISKLITLEKLLEKVSESPKLTLFPLELLQQQSVIDVETLKIKPDINLNGGYRIFDVSKSGNISFVIGISIPIPAFNQNQGIISEAELKLEKLKLEKNVVEYNLKLEIIENYTTIINSYNEIINLKENIIPEAEKIFNSINEGYILGKFNYLDVLDAQKTVFQVKARYIKSISEYKKPIIEMEKIIGKKISNN